MQYRKREETRAAPGLLATSVVAAAACFATPFAITATAREPPALLGIPIEFILFALVLLGVPVFHRHTLRVALTGLATIALYAVGYAIGFPVMLAMLGWNPAAKRRDPPVAMQAPGALTERVRTNERELEWT